MPKPEFCIKLQVNKEKITREDLQRAHSRGFVENLFPDQLEQEIIRTYELIDDNGRYHRYNPANASRNLTNLFDDILLKVAATVQCCRVALKHGFCFSFGGGNHHAQFEYGAGFCLLNDIVIAPGILNGRRIWQKILGGVCTVSIMGVAGLSGYVLLIFFFEKMSGMIFVLLGDITIVNHKHIPIDVRDMTAGHIEVLKCAIDDFIGRYNMVIVSHDVI